MKIKAAFFSRRIKQGDQMKTKKDKQAKLWAATALIVSMIGVNFFYDALYPSWGQVLQATGAFVSQMSPVYISALMILLGILAYIAFKVKRTEHLSS
jgi:hypothetical protein